MAIYLDDCSADPRDRQVVEFLRNVQNKVSWVDRNMIARQISDARNSQFPNPFSGCQNEKLLQEFRVRGVCDAPISISKDVCDEVLAYFSSRPCYAEHMAVYSDGITRSIEETAKTANYASYTLEENLAAPYLLEFALDPKLLDLAGGYLGCIPSLYSINTFWSFPSPLAGHTMTFHFDEDDFRFVTVFIYWSGIEKSEGEFYFVEKTHDVDQVETRIREKRWARILSRSLRPVRNADDFRRQMRSRRERCLFGLFSNELTCFTAPRGRALMVDTFGIHRGSLPRTKKRLCTWFRYGLYANQGYGSDRTRPVAATVKHRIQDDKATRFITRLVLDWTSMTSVN